LKVIVSSVDAVVDVEKFKPAAPWVAIP